MKKFLLIDDINKLNYDYNNDGKFSTVMERISCCKEFQSINDFNNYACVMVHSTFDMSNMALLITKSKTQNGFIVPLVEFSLNYSSSELLDANESLYLKINKKTFYNNLELFLNSYKNNNTINFNLLRYGEKVDIEKLKECATRILNVITPLHSIITEQDIKPIINDLETLINLSQPEIGIQFEDLLNEVKKERITTDSISYKVKKITKSFIDYGKNICHW